MAGMDNRIFRFYYTKDGKKFTEDWHIDDSRIIYGLIKQDKTISEASYVLIAHDGPPPIYASRHVIKQKP